MPQTVAPSKHKSRGKRKPLPTRDSKSSTKGAVFDVFSSSPLKLFPPRAPSPVNNTSQLLDGWQANPVRVIGNHTISKDNKESFAATLSTITPGAFHVLGDTSPAAMVDEMIDLTNVMDETENVDDHGPIVVAAHLVPDEDEMVADIKKQLEKEIKEDVEMRLMTEGQAPFVAAEAFRANTYSKAQWQSWAGLLVALIIAGTVTAVIVTKTRDSNNDSPSEESRDTTRTVTVCLGATPIQKGQIAISSWIDPAIRPDGLAFSAACTIFNQISEPNAWFSLIGTGDVYAVSTCSRDLNFDSAISIGTGSMCDNVVCIAFADFNQKRECTETSYGAATVLFRTDVGVPYYIGVEGKNGPSQGNFTLLITTVNDAPVNSDCSNSLVIQPGESLIPGTITNATEDMHFNYPPEWVSGWPSVWYTFVGTGDVFEISTCTGDLNFDSAITVFTGSCENHEVLVFTTADPYDCSETEYIAATVNFHTEVGVDYFLQVYPVIESSPSWTGEFTLVVLSGPAPANDDCSSASRVEPGNSSILGSMSHASWDTIVASCIPNRAIVWYSLIGTGDVYAISTCSSALTFDNAISVLVGTCDSLTCMISGWSIQDVDCPDAPYRAAKIRFGTEIGVEYFLAVEATNSTWEGNFTLEVSTAEPLPNDGCSGALDIQANNRTVHGAMKGATPSIYFDYDPFVYNDVWYRMVGNGTNTVASVCSNATTSLLTIQIYEGDGEICDQVLIENATLMDSCGAHWFAMDGVPYYIRVSCMLSEAPFELTVSMT